MEPKDTQSQAESSDNLCIEVCDVYDEYCSDVCFESEEDRERSELINKPKQEEEK